MLSENHNMLGGGLCCWSAFLVWCTFHLNKIDEKVQFIVVAGLHELENFVDLNEKSSVSVDPSSRLSIRSLFCLMLLKLGG